MNSVWVVTSEVNAYDQFGEYFECVYANKPTFEQAKEFLISRNLVHIGDVGLEEKVNFFLDGYAAGNKSDWWATLQEVELK